MTALDTTRATSDNSVSHDSDTPLARRQEHRRILEYVYDQPRTVTESKIAVEAGWTIEGTHHRLSYLEQQGYVQLVETTAAVHVLLTEDGEQVATGGWR